MTEMMRMVRIRRTVTVTSELPVDGWLKGASYKSDGEQMTDDEIREFELCGGDKEKLADLLEEALQMEPPERQDFATQFEFYDVPLEDNSEDIEEVVPNAGSAD